jgi:hypothetical protein
MNTESETKMLICECNSAEHQIIIHYEQDENVAYCHIHLSKRSFMKRLVLGLRYIFGYHCVFGHWDEFVITDKHAQALRRLAWKLEEKKHENLIN